MSAYAGYFSFMDNTHKIVIDRDALEGAWDNDYMMLIGRCGTYILIVVGIPVLYAPCRL